MKFRGVMIDPLSMKEFSNITVTLSKLCKEYVVRIAAKKMYFIISDECNGPRRPLIWCELDPTLFFSEYLMEGVDELHRDIYLQINSGNISRALIALKQSAKCVKMKLTKKQEPCLTLEIELLTSNSPITREITHDIPVTIVPRKSWDDYREPVPPNYHLCMEMPSFKQLKTIVDRMKTMSSDLIIKANEYGKMIFQIETELATVSSRFENLRVESFDGSRDSDEDDEQDKEFVTCRIDIKMFANILSANQTNFSKLLCSMVHMKLLNLYLKKEDTIFQCFLPCKAY